MFYSQRHANGRFLLRLLLTAVFLIPIFWMLMASLMAPGVPLPTTFRLIPDPVTLENYGRIWQIVPFGRFLLNSLLVVITAVPITIMTSSWAGFAMSQLPDARQKRLITLSLLILMVPSIALWTTRFMLYRWLGILDTRLALILPAFMGSSPFFVLMYYRAFRRISKPIFEASRLEGATVFESWRYIGMPQIYSTTLGVGILSFILYWGDFNSPLLYLSDQSKYTLPLALQLLQQLNRSDWPLLMTGSVLVTAVPLVLFIIILPLFRNINPNVLSGIK
ncbi:MAG: carbohydrate ABC transporter permease [Chloroflexota bacterium]